MIEVSNLRKRFGDNEALKGISFRVQPAEIYGLLGPNGAGKSTTIGILCGLVKPDAGQASLKGIDIEPEIAETKSAAPRSTRARSRTGKGSYRCASM